MRVAGALPVGRGLHAFESVVLGSEQAQEQTEIAVVEGMARLEEVVEEALVMVEKVAD